MIRLSGEVGRERRLQISGRSVRAGLGVLWIVDAILQMQPQMFHRGFVTQMILPNASGQPFVVALAIRHGAELVAAHVGVFNAGVVGVQLLIGVGLLFTRSAKMALAVSFGWAATVWLLGEGLGMLLTGTASPLGGAPGAVVLYAVIGILVWPGKHEPGVPTGRTQESTRANAIESAPASAGPLGTAGPLVAWAVYWVGGAILWLLPVNRDPGAMARLLAGAAAPESGSYNRMLARLALGAAGHGSETALVLCAASVAIGLGPLLSRRLVPWLVAGATLSMIYWITGQGLGQTLTGMGTDPNAGPLVILLAVAMRPNLRLDLSERVAPIRLLAVRYRFTLGAIASGFVVAAVASASSATAAVPIAAMAMGAHSAAVDKVSLQLPMAGMGGAGSGSNSWHYGGPALPTGEADLLTSVFDATELGHKMQTPDCTTPPTIAQQIAAMQLVQSTSQAVARYKVLANAVAAGYVPVTSPSYPVVHYVKPSYLNQQDVLDPNHVQSLVYAFTPNGPVLAAAMYLMPTVGEPGPMPGGCLTQWHAHTNLCVSDSSGLIVGFSPCGAGTYQERTAFMLHVWQLPVPGGPLQMDPSDLQVVEAAIEAQRRGEAPLHAPSSPSARTTSVAG